MPLQSHFEMNKQAVENSAVLYNTCFKNAFFTIPGSPLFLFANALRVVSILDSSSFMQEFFTTFAR